jgi:hypothetical protein
LGASGGGVPSAEAEEQLCNGRQDLCDRTFSEVAFAGTHNSFTAGFQIAAKNQNNDLMQQLSDGIRYVNFDVYLDEASQKLVLYHSLSSLGQVDFGETCLAVVAFLEANQNEVSRRHPRGCKQTNNLIVRSSYVKYAASHTTGTRDGLPLERQTIFYTARIFFKANRASFSVGLVAALHTILYILYYTANNILHCTACATGVGDQYGR